MRVDVGRALSTRGLTRDIIKEAMANLADRRAWQVTQGGIACPTRLKFFEGGGLRRTRCGRCGAEDSFQRLLHCTGLILPEPSSGSEATVAFLVDLAHRASAIHKGIPIRRRPSEAEEIERTPVSDADDQETDEGDELSLTAPEYRRQSAGTEMATHSCVLAREGRWV